MRVSRIVLLVGFGLVSIAPLSYAAPNPAVRSAGHEVTGTVKDALGRPIPRAQVALQNSSGATVAKGTTDATGHFGFKNIAPGVYAVVVHGANFKPGTAIVSVSGAGAKPVEIALESEAAINLAVRAKRLNQSRSSLSPETGGSVYRFSEEAIHELPQGANTQLNQVLLQAPSVAQDSYGQVHVRGDHGNLQYRINRVQLPEGITGFGQVLSPRFARSISLLTGALPAEFGLRTAGVVDIKTRDGAAQTGGVEFYGGQRNTEQPSFEYGGSHGDYQYFVTGNYLHTDRGLEPPTSGPTPIHDTAHEGQGFGYFSYFLNPTTRLSLIAGSAVNHFEIPDNPGQSQVFTLAGVPNYPSADLDERQFEQNYFGVLALQGVIGPKFSYQVAPFIRYSTVSFNPDIAGDLIYNGAASRVFRSAISTGLQADGSYQLSPEHTLRLGGYFTGERAEVDNHELVFPANSSGQQTSDHPFPIVDNVALTAWTYSVYAQDEWKPIEHLTVNLGVRFDLYDGLVRADQASPRVGVEYEPINGTVLHAGYARFFTPPQTELVTVAAIAKFQGTTGAPPSSGNDTPTVERDHYFDAGFTQVVLPGLNLGIDSYYKKAVDLIDEGQFGPALIFENFNYRKGRVYGVELTSSYTHENLYTYANWDYSVAQGTQIESGQFNFAPDELRYINSHYVFLDHDQTFSASAGAIYNWHDWMFTVDGIYGSGLRRGFANTGNLPYYIQIDAAIARRFILPDLGLNLPDIGRMEARIAVVNLFDRTYQIRNGTGIGVFAAQYGPRRGFFGALKWELPVGKAKGAGVS